MENITISEIEDEITSASQLDGNELILISDTNTDSTYTSKKVNLTNVKGFVGTTINNQNKTVTPSISSQTINADSGYTGLGTVSINAVTSSIDSNIVPQNIRKGIIILGVTGTYEGGTPTPTYTVSLNVNPTGGGTVTGSGTYTKGTSVTISASPSSNYHFVMWSDGNTSSTRTITVNSSVSLTATFSIVPIIMNISGNGARTVVGEDGNTYNILGDGVSSTTGANTIKIHLSNGTIDDWSGSLYDRTVSGTITHVTIESRRYGINNNTVTCKDSTHATGTASGYFLDNGTAI